MWLNSSSIDNEEEEEEDDEEEEETLSLRDLPNNEENYQTKKLESPRRSVTQEVFDFCCFLKNSTMCSADEVFFQGQILPLHHLNSLPSDSHTAGPRGGDTCNEASSTEYSSSEDHTLQLRTESREHCHYSINSSITSSLCSWNKPRIQNQFHSQPSPTPQVRFSKIKHRNITCFNRKSKMCSLFRVGLMTTPEIALQDLKIRCNKNFDISRDSSNSSSSSSNDEKMRIILSKKEKKSSFLGSCKCSVNAVETVQSKVVAVNRCNTNCKEDKKEIKHKMSRTSNV